MSFNSIHIKFKEKSNINLNNSKILELFRLSIGNSLNNLNYQFIQDNIALDNKLIYKMTNIPSQGYNKNQKQSKEQSLEINFFFLLYLSS